MEEVRYKMVLFRPSLPSKMSIESRSRNRTVFGIGFGFYFLWSNFRTFTFYWKLIFHLCTAFKVKRRSQRRGNGLWYWGLSNTNLYPSQNHSPNRKMPRIFLPFLEHLKHGYISIFDFFFFVKILCTIKNIEISFA